MWYIFLVLLSCLHTFLWASPMTKPSTTLYIVEGLVYNEDTNAAIEKVKLFVTDKQAKETDTVFTNKDGKFSLILDPHKAYRIVAYHAHYFAMSQAIEFQTVQHRKQYDLQIPLKEIFLGKALLVEKINFSVNDTAFTIETSPALKKFYRILSENPQISVEIAVHTDARGDDEYNAQLSQQRADRMIAYLQTQGIEAHRLMGKGYGESRLVNHCTNGVRCSGAEHNANRRVEFIVVKLLE